MRRKNIAALLGFGGGSVGLIILIFFAGILGYGVSVGDIANSVVYPGVYYSFVGCVLGIAGSLITTSKPLIGGILMLAGGIVNLFGIIFIWATAGLAFFCGGVLALFDAKRDAAQFDTNRNSVIPRGCLVGLGLILVVALIALVLNGPRVGGIFSKVTSGLR